MTFVRLVQLVELLVTRATLLVAAGLLLVAAVVAWDFAALEDRWETPRLSWRKVIVAGAVLAYVVMLVITWRGLR